ncbi:MAG: phosphodiester glycosidase family protein, partial [Defluviitaleaceae bacterium]|nr:phosphodiester glycosidase family protein [Defluviitaleaceae bacterium]
MKKIIKGVAASLGVAAILSTIHSYNVEAKTFYENRETTRLSRNTYLHQSTRVTSAGIVDINVLEIPMDDPNLEIAVFNSQTEFGLKQPLTTLLNQQDALAGVNGDFFGLAGTHSVPLGFEAINGHLSIHQDLNQPNATSASLVMHSGGAFIQYIRPEVSLLLNGQPAFNVGMVNMVTTLAFPSFITYEYLQSTASLDARLGRSYKVVVQNGVITAITHFTVDVPQNGFVVVMSPQTFATYRHHLYVGQRAEMNITANIDLDAVHTAISGGYRILSFGEISNAVSRGTARHPRTLLGLNQAGDRLILMTIDGRGYSAGASLREAALFMQEFGAFHAINMDGGGSTTMAASLPGEAMQVINTVSDRWQRSIINAIGVINNSITGEVAYIQINIAENIAVGVATPFTINAFDSYMNPVFIGLDTLSINISDNAVLTPYGIVANQPGEVFVVAYAMFRRGVYDVATTNAVEITQISTNVNRASGNASLGNLRGYSNYGHMVPLTYCMLTFTVYPHHLGHMAGNNLVVTGEGNGWLEITLGQARRIVPIEQLNQQTTPIDPIGLLSFASYPATVEGRAFYTTPTIITLTYDFAASQATQGAFLNFADPR